MTRKVKIFVLIDPDGNYNASGYSIGQGHADKDDLNFVWDGMETGFEGNEIRGYWVEAEIPIPTQECPIIKGTVNEVKI